ncbi:MAG: hypothetical protein ACRCW9_10095, partial [Cetobacterium sp.]
TKNELISLKSNFEDKKTQIENLLMKEINNKRVSLNKINLLINNKNNFLTDDIKINFNSDFCYHSNFGFNYLNNKGILTSQSTNNELLKPIEYNFDNNKNVLKVSFENNVKINQLQFSFLDIDLNPIVPVNIFYNDYSSKFKLIPNWNNKVKKESFDLNFNNTFVLDPKEIKHVYFEFEDKINLNQSKVAFYKTEYVLNSEVIYKAPIKELNGFLLNKETFEEFVDLDFYYSLDNKEYNKIIFENKINKTIFDETKIIDGLFIKLKRGKFNYSEFNTKIETEEEVLNSQQLKENEITFNVSLKTDYKIIIDNDLYIKLNEIIPDFFNKRIDGLIEINNKYIRQIKEISAIQKLTLKNSNNFKIYNQNNYPVFYKDELGYLYLPKCFADKDFNIVYKEEKTKEIYNEKDFTPICFGFNLNFI